jgi:hypothetical protein
MPQIENVLKASSDRDDDDVSVQPCAKHHLTASTYWPLHNSTIVT